MHKLVAKQLLKNGIDVVPASLQSFINAVDNAYCEFERDIVLMERSIDISTREYNEITEKLKKSNDELTTIHEELLYLSFHDELTGLYNRAYMNMTLSRLQEENITPVGMIVCDTDGLKLVNDSFGHAAGDEFLAEAARIIRCCSRPKDILCRIDGDEFIIIMPLADEEMVLHVTNKIKGMLAAPENQQRGIPVSLSSGYSMKTDTTRTLAEVMQEADNHMYKAKLLQVHSTRSSIIQTLMKMLSERDLVTEAHSQRLEYMIEWFASVLKLPSFVITNLKLLAKFHDIGKSGIPDEILKKPGQLTVTEREKMQKHSEIGFRIASTSSELAPIAKLILMHHEWWNGKGYPLGIAGEKIPLECRALAIVDSFDAMTDDRPYRKAMKKKDAFAEIRRCSGTQFDPYLADVFVEAAENTLSFQSNVMV